ncbi:hypothetical protein MNBD_NITROSPINAE02-677 [hydrothermal vent metagenome]|uniref:PilZ domain-containing protein n=1 Tax=hydrothermal vent metagenome TaxID=652676 RepID=A0A3B1C4A1_9ZZZZ
MSDSDKKSSAREFFRLGMKMPIKYRFAKKIERGKYQVSKSFNGLGVEFGGGGLSFNAGKHLPIGTLTLLEMTFPFSRTPVMATGEVVHREYAEHKGKKASHLGIRFLLIDDNERDKMVAFLISRGKTAP